MRFPQKRGKRSPNLVAEFTAAHSMTEGQKRKINRETGPKKNIISVAEWEQQVLDSVPINYRKYLESLIKEYQDIFPETLPKVYLPYGEYSVKLKLNLAVNPPTDNHICWVLLSRMSSKNRWKISWIRVSFVHYAVHMGHWYCSCRRKTADGRCV